MTHAPRPLTPAQERVAALVAEGLSNAAIAERLAISPNTVHSHIAAISIRLPGDGKLRVRIALWFARRQDRLARSA